MTGSGSPVSEGEWVYRRVPLAWWPNPREGRPKIDAFLPAQRDRDGLSVNVVSLTSIDKIIRGDKPYHVCCLSVAALRGEFSLDIVHDPVPGNPAHALVPALSRARYEADKPGHKALADRMIRALLAPDETRLGHFVLIALPDVAPAASSNTKLFPR